MSADKGNYDVLKLENQLCFPLYAAAKEVVSLYRPFLDPLGLTYTQYILMMVLWEEKQLTAKEIGERLFLDSGTLTPVLKKLEEKGFLTRKRSEEDERSLLVTITESGEELKDAAVRVSSSVGCCIPLDGDEALQLYTLLHKLLSRLK